MTDTSNEKTPSEVDFNTMSPEEFSDFDLDAYLKDNSDSTIDNSEDEDNTENSEEKTVVTDMDTNIDDTKSDDEVEDTDVLEPNDNQDTEELSKTAMDFYNSIIGKPIKANGHEIVFDDPTKVIQAIQMGVNYTKRMQELKPVQGAIKALNDAELLQDEKRLTQLMDIAKGNKNAFIAFAKENNIDLDSIDTEDNVEYTPESSIPSEQEMNITEVVDGIKDAGLYDGLSKNLGSDFTDDGSQTIFANNPQLLQALAADIDKGVYTKVMSNVAMSKLLGDNRATIDIYIEKFSEMEKNPPITKEKQVTTANVVKKKEKGLADAISKTPVTSNRKKKTKGEIPDVDFFSMSQEDADKFYKEHLAGIPV